MRTSKKFNAISKKVVDRAIKEGCNTIIRVETFSDLCNGEPMKTMSHNVFHKADYIVNYYESGEIILYFTVYAKEYGDYDKDMIKEIEDDIENYLELLENVDISFGLLEIDEPEKDESKFQIFEGDINEKEFSKNISSKMVSIRGIYRSENEKEIDINIKAIDYLVKAIDTFDKVYIVNNQILNNLDAYTTEDPGISPFMILIENRKDNELYIITNPIFHTINIVSFYNEYNLEYISKILTKYTTYKTVNIISYLARGEHERLTYGNIIKTTTYGLNLDHVDESDVEYVKEYLDESTSLLEMLTINTVPTVGARPKEGGRYTNCYICLDKDRSYEVLNMMKTILVHSDIDLATCRLKKFTAPFPRECNSIGVISINLPNKCIVIDSAIQTLTFKVGTVTPEIEKAAGLYLSKLVSRVRKNISISFIDNNHTITRIEAGTMNLLEVLD